MLAVLTKIAEEPRDWDSDKIFVDSEYDSNQTVFERRSNQC